MRFDMEAIYKLFSPKQFRSVVESMDPAVKICVWSGAVSSGKTISSLVAFLIALVNAPTNGVIIIVGKTLQTIERNIFEDLLSPSRPLGPFSKWVHHTAGANTATVLGRTVHLIGANDVTAETKIRGVTASLIYIDEATIIPESFWQMCISRLRVEGARLFATTNPDGPMHWLRQKFLLKADEPDVNLRQWHFTLDDSRGLPAGTIAHYKAVYTGLFYRRFILGEWCLAEGAIYESWDADYHIVDDLPPMRQWVSLGIDYGATNPFAAELLGLGVDGCLYVASEYYYDPKLKYRQKVEDEYSRDVRDWLANVPVPGSNPVLYGARPVYTVIDPSAPSFRMQLQKDGLDAMNADNEVLAGIQMIASLLATSRLRIHRSCKGLISEIPSYSWDPDKAAKGKDEPVKVADHACDALRYAVMSTEAVWRDQLRQPMFRLAA